MNVLFLSVLVVIVYAAFPFGLDLDLTYVTTLIFKK